MPTTAKAATGPAVAHSRPASYRYRVSEAGVAGPRSQHAPQGSDTPRDVPGGSVVKNLPARGHGLEPWSGKIPHAVEQLGP